MLLAIAYKIVGRTFVLRTIFGVTVVALAIGVCEGFFMGLGHPLIPDRTVSLVLGAILCGVGVGTCFIHNGSSGGTDIVAACVSKVSNASIGRIMISLRPHCGTAYRDAYTYYRVWYNGDVYSLFYNRPDYKYKSAGDTVFHLLA